LAYAVVDAIHEDLILIRVYVPRGADPTKEGVKCTGKG